MTNESPDHEPKKRGLKPWLALAGLAVVLLAVVYFEPLGGSGNATGHPAVGQTLPPLVLAPLTGTVDAADTSQLRGSVVVINFWGTWCGPCRIEFPHLVALHEQYRERTDFKLLAVSCTPGFKEQLDDLSKTTLAYLEGMDAQLPTYADPDGIARQKLESTIGFKGYPTTLVIDRNGVIRGIWVGYQSGNEQEVERLVASLLVRQ